MMISLTLTEKDWDEVIDALKTISYKYDDNNCDKLAEKYVEANNLYRD